MRFLIDECLHTSLVALAQQAGYEAAHLAWLGRSGRKDWHVMSLVLSEDWTLVTNDAFDLATRYGKAEVHAGLIVIVPQVRPARQQMAFAAILGHVAGRELINKVVECRITVDQIAITEYDMPPF